MAVNTKTRLPFFSLYCVSLICLIFLGACTSQPVKQPGPDQVVVPAADPTPPAVTLAIHDLPLQPGATSQPNPESIDHTCCDITRELGSHSTVTLSAEGRDDDGGIKAVWISINIKYTCSSRSGRDQLMGENFPQYDQDKSAAKAGDLAQKTRMVQYVMSIDELRGTCLRLSEVEERFCAEAQNFYGGSDQSKCITLTYKGDPA